MQIIPGTRQFLHSVHQWYLSPNYAHKISTPSVVLCSTGVCHLYIKELYIRTYIRANNTDDIHTYKSADIIQRYPHLRNCEQIWRYSHLYVSANIVGQYSHIHFKIINVIRDVKFVFFPNSNFVIKIQILFELRSGPR